MYYQCEFRHNKWKDQEIPSFIHPVKDSLSLKTPGVDSMCYEPVRSMLCRAAGRLRPKRKISTFTVTTHSWISWQWQSTCSTENITSSLRDTKIISKPPFMDCITREMTEIELHPNPMNRGLLHLEQIIEMSYSVLRKWRKPSHDDTPAFLRTTN